MDLRKVDEVAVSPQSEDRVLIWWRQAGGWSSFAYVDEDSGWVDPGDVLWWLLSQGARLELVRPALSAAYPAFDVDAEVDRVTMPDRAEKRAKDEQRRRDARAEFMRARRQR
ncbi:hypothetical protein EV644_10644 [Kribbella orskensis]|uniref:Uncharacterized protein n=1 Tax=Kribbella orskensis TaxID=2512216 RepID=A0ABY2BJR6_9ACTN|nr:MULTISPECIES: hypothetical protein [Kribbella]TCN40117.1 hypothetical protein EV642_10544 [Kribbella sp. VKM Ac-2500]TCO22737.1 hypothetical protein EV644_10644 [Kribbella orskensis]